MSNEPVRYEFPIDYSKVREFARAVMSTHEAHQGPTPTIPPTMLTSGRMIWEPREDSAYGKVGFDRSRILHGEEEFIFHTSPPKAGDVLELASRIDERWEKEGKRGGVMKFARVVTEFWNERGELVVTQNSIVVETARPPASEESVA